MDYSDLEAITWPFQLTEGLHRELYPLLDPARPEYSARGKNVLITGASGGVARCIAEAWCIAEADGVLITGRNIDLLNEVAEKISAISKSTKVVVHPADITQEESVAQLWAKAKAELGQIHVLINSAGTMKFAQTGEDAPSQWWRDFEVNVKGSYLNDYHFLKQGGGEGTLITVGTGAAAMLAPGFSSYTPSKLAQTKLTEFLQLEHPQLRAFTLLPGLLPTGITAKPYYPFAKDDPMLSGGLSLFLCTPRADWLKGQVISVNWDIEEMEKHREEIQSKKLLNVGYLYATLQKGGHPWT